MELCLPIDLKQLFPKAMPLVWRATFGALIACLSAVLISGCTSDPEKHADPCDYEVLFTNAIKQSGYSISSKNKDQLRAIFDLFFHEIDRNECRERTSFNYWDTTGLTAWQKFNGLRIPYYLTLQRSANNEICLAGFRLAASTSATYSIYCKNKGWTWGKRKDPNDYAETPSYSK